MSGAVVVVSLMAAAAFALSSALKHASAGRVRGGGALPPRTLGRFVVATLAHPLWLGGIVADVVGLSLQVTALHLGPLSLVQPLLVTNLVFALAFRQAAQRRLQPRTLGWAGVLVVALVGFLALSGSARLADHPQPADHGPAVVAAVIGAVVVTAFVALAQRRGSEARSATLLGVAVGTVYAGTAALLKSVTDIAAHGLPELLTAWQLYTVIAVGILGLLLNQLAFRAGPLSASLPAISTVDPLLSIVIGVSVYDEHLRHGPGPFGGLALILLVLTLAVVQLSRQEARAESGAGPG